MTKVRAKKHLGQHFLLDKSIAETIVNLLDYKYNNNILEVGPGMGILTDLLIRKEKDLSVIEIDEESIHYLKSRYPETSIRIIQFDFLKIEFSQYFNSPVSIIGNFPYNISSQILFKVLDNKDQITELVGMFQMEVAQRVAALKGRRRGILSVFIQAFFHVEYCLTVDENVFSPIPKVKSGVIRLNRNNRKQLDCNESQFMQIVKTAYNQRRKTLRNSIKGFNLNENLELKELLKKRAEDLSVEEFITITRNVKQ